MAQRAATYRPPVHARQTVQPKTAGRGLVVQRSALVVVASGLADTTANQSGQIYGIYKNEEYPNAIKQTSLAASKCLYVGKTSRGEDLGGRFVEHVKNDSKQAWCVDGGCDYTDKDDDKWPYVVRNLWAYNGVTKLDVAIAEQFYIQMMKQAGAKLCNLRNEITLSKFNEVKDSGAWTTQKGYDKNWKPVDVLK